MNPISMLSMTSSATSALKKIKSYFVKDPKPVDLKPTLETRADSIEQKVQLHSEKISALAEEHSALKNVVEEHNEVLLNLTQALQKLEAESGKSKLVGYAALLLSIVAILLSSILAIK